MSDDRFTVVSFHAHPDDEALLTSGTLARAAADGHRVVIVVATAGEAGLTRDDWAADGLGGRRAAELAQSARAIGAARVEVLGYPDSGWSAAPTATSTPPEGTPSVYPSGPDGADPYGSDDHGRDPVGPVPFSQMDVEALATDLAALLTQEAADVLTVYDANGGYGHPDHIQVHRVGVRAAELARTPVVLEATVDRETLGRAVSVLRRLAKIVPMPGLPDVSQAYSAHADITHRVDVHHQLRAKVAALRAHVSQAKGATGGDVRTLALLLRLPRPVRHRALRYEWFTERGRRSTEVKIDDIFASRRPLSGD
jgi:LmbE family N-acetylglucosaminyl deacetylase